MTPSISRLDPRVLKYCHALASYAYGNPRCRVEQRELARDCGVTERTIRNWQKLAEKAGVVLVSRRKGGNEYDLTPLWELAERDVAKSGNHACRSEAEGTVSGRDRKTCVPVRSRQTRRSHKETRQGQSVSDSIKQNAEAGAQRAAPRPRSDDLAMARMYAAAVGVSDPGFDDAVASRPELPDDTIRRSAATFKDYACKEPPHHPDAAFRGWIEREGRPRAQAGPGSPVPARAKPSGSYSKGTQGYVTDATLARMGGPG
jgi:hypothetical protein